MESLVNYGSDDDQELENSQSTMGRTRDGYRGREHEDNYENVGMDMSDEESNNNSPPHRNDDKRSKNNRFERPQESSTSRTKERSRSRERNGRYGSKTREDNQYGRKSYDDYKRRSKTPHDSRSYYENRQSQNRESKIKDLNRSDYGSDYDKKDSSYDSLRNRDRRRDDRREKRRSSSRDYKRSNSKERVTTDKRSKSPSRYVRNRSRSRERRDESRGRDRRDRSKSRDRKDRSRSRSRKERSKSYDRKDRSKSRERKERSRSRDRKERSRSRDHKERSRSPQRYKGSRYDRTSNKLAVLEKLGIEIKTPDCQFVTPQMLMQKSMTDKIEEVKNATGIELPKYYNPAVMNPSRYAEQIQKRRLLWGNKNKSTESDQQKCGNSNSSSTSSSATSSNAAIPKIWQQTKFVHDSDGKVASKFKRLMGIKDDTTVPKELTNAETLKKQEEMFHSMEAQYEVARAATHTMRGVGLGFGAFTGNFPR